MDKSRFRGRNFLPKPPPPSTTRPVISGPIEVTSGMYPPRPGSSTQSALPPIPSDGPAPPGPVPSRSFDKSLPPVGAPSFSYLSTGMEDPVKKQLIRRLSTRGTSQGLDYGGAGGGGHSSRPGTAGHSDTSASSNRYRGPGLAPGSFADRPTSSRGYGNGGDNLSVGMGPRTDGSRPTTARQNSSPRRADGLEEGVAAMRINSEDFREPHFNAGLYIAEKLGNCTEEEIKVHRDELIKLKNRTSTDQQLNVYRHRANFIEISKEVGQVTDGMRVIRSLISDLIEVIDSTSSNTEPVATENSRLAASRRALNRSSIANLEALWNTQLQVLWKRVEGSQKFLPAVPGRHIVYESGRWVELNAATWRTSHKVHIVLLNDHFLIAVEKRRQETKDERDRDMDRDRDRDRDLNQASHIARHCWLLQDVQIADISIRSAGKKEKGTVTSAINVRVGPDTFTYAVTNKYRDEKTNLLAAFRKAVEEHRKAEDLENRERNQGDDSIAAIAGGNLMNSSLTGEKLLDFSSTLSQQIGTTVEIEGRHHPLREIDGELDELDIDIALHRFEDAIRRLQALQRLAKGIKINPAARDLLTGMIGIRIQRVANLITKELVEDNSKEEKVRMCVEWLARVGCTNMARQAYFGVRSDLLRKRVRQCVFEGDLHLYIYQVAYIYFTMIRNTIDIYQRCFLPALTGAFAQQNSRSDLHSSDQTGGSGGGGAGIGSNAGVAGTAAAGSTTGIAFPNMGLSAVVVWAQKHVEALSRHLDVQLSNLERGGEAWTECVRTVKRLALILDDLGTEFGKLVEGVVDGMADVPLESRPPWG